MADKNVDAEITVEFEEVNSRQQLISGEKICTLFSKITKIFSDLKAICFSGSYNDLSDTPDVVTKEYVDPIKSHAAINRTTLGVQCKNLLKNETGNTAMGGVTFTHNSDGSVTLNGTSNGQILYSLMSNGFENIIGKKCILTGCPANGSNSTFGIYIRVGASKYVQDNGSGITFITNTINWIDIVVRSGVTFDNVTFYPMIRYADITDDTYEPYKENVDERLIKNKSDIAVNKTTLGYQSKNLLDVRNYASKYTAGVTASPNGVDGLTFSGTANNTFYLAWNDKAFSLKKGDYILSYAGDITSDKPNNTFLRVRKSDNTIICDLPLSQTSKSFSLNVDDELYFIAVYTNVTANVQGTIKPMIRYADITDDTYEPYKENVDERLIKNKSDIAVNKTTLGYQSKNLLNLKSKVGTYTSNGITFVINDDGSVTANGTATANVFFYMLRNDSALGNLIYGKEVKLTGCPEGGSASTYSLRSLNVYNNNSGALIDIGDGKVFTYTNTEKLASFYIAIAEGVTVTDLTFYPMLRYAEITDDTFETYKPTIQEQINSKAESKILYSSDTGSRIVTLSEAPSKYDYLMIFISGIGAGTQCINIPGSSNFHNAIITGSPTPTQSNTPYLIGVLATLSDTNKTVALTYGEKISITSSGNTLEEIPSTIGYITKVIGFKSG